MIESDSCFANIRRQEKASATATAPCLTEHHEWQLERQSGWTRRRPYWTVVQRWTSNAVCDTSREDGWNILGGRLCSQKVLTRIVTSARPGKGQTSFPARLQANLEE